MIFNLKELFKLMQCMVQISSIPKSLHIFVANVCNLMYSNSTVNWKYFYLMLSLLHSPWFGFYKLILFNLKTAANERSSLLQLPSSNSFHWCHPGPETCPDHSPAFQSHSLTSQMAWWCILGNKQQQCPWAESRQENAACCSPLLADRLLSGRLSVGLSEGK